MVYFKAARPLDSLGYVVVALFGAGFFTSLSGAPAARLLLGIFIIAELLMSSLFLLNNRFDLELDRASGPAKAARNPMAIGFISPLVGEIVAIAAAVSGLLLIILWFRSPSSIAFYVLAWLTGLLYSAPPLRLKARAGLDVLSHGAVVLFLFLLGSSFAISLNAEAVIFAIPFIMLSTIYELRNHLKDWPADSSAGVRTSVALLGPRAAWKMLLTAVILFWTSAIGVGYLLGIWFMILAGAIATSSLVFSTLNPRRLELIFDSHLWIIGGAYSAFKLLMLAGLL